MAGNILELMGATAGALALIDRMVENPKARRRTSQSLRDAHERGGRQAYKNYLLTFNNFDGRWYISRGGAHISSADSLSKAKAMIDEIADNPKARSRNPGTMLQEDDAMENPRGRSRRPVTRRSQATGKPPTKRLVARRMKTARAPKGFFANPDARAGWCYFGIKVNAGNDVNGNPRRAIAFFRHDGHGATLLAVVKEDSRGLSSAIIDAGLDPKTTPVIGTFDVSVSQFRELLKTRPGTIY